MYISRSSRQRLQSLLLFTDKYIYEYSDVSPEYKDVCDKSVNRLFRIAVEDILLFVGAIFLLGAIPMHSNLFLHQKMSFFPMILPGTDPETITGFFLNQSFQLACGTLGFIGMVRNSFRTLL